MREGRKDKEWNSEAGVRHSGRLARAILNGVMGDYLAKENNPLAIQMGFYHQGERLYLNKPQTNVPLTNSLLNNRPLTNRVVVMIHGLTNLETVWDYPSIGKEQNPDHDQSLIDESKAAEGQPRQTNYGLNLQRDFHYTPFYLRYNTGLSIEQNGRDFADQLSALFEAYPIEIDELVLVGFSMGGLLMRHAQHHAKAHSHRWLSSLSTCFYLGTPHEGSPLEKFGHITSTLMRQIPRDYISRWADWIDFRSEGIQNLKHGMKFFSCDEEDDSLSPGFLPSARHCFISGGLGKDESDVFSYLFGDSLVRQTSAFPDNAPEHSRHMSLTAMPHVTLAHSDRVYKIIAGWIKEDAILRGKNGVSNTDFQPQATFERRESEAPESPAEKGPLLVDGAVRLVADGYHATLDMVETMQSSIAHESYYVLDRVPLIREVSNPIRALHDGIANQIFTRLKQAGELVSESKKSR